MLGRYTTGPRPAESSTKPPAAQPDDHRDGGSGARLVTCRAFYSATRLPPSLARVGPRHLCEHAGCLGGLAAGPAGQGGGRRDPFAQGPSPADRIEGGRGGWRRPPPP